MAQDFKINGVTLNYVMIGEWREVEDSQALDGQTVHNRWREHLWRLNEAMPVSEFNTLYALEGQKVTIVTTDYANRNGAYAIYYGAELRRVAGRHVALNMEQFQCEFRVRL